MALVNPFLRFTKTTDFLLKSPVLRARVLKRLLKESGHFLGVQKFDRGKWGRTQMGSDGFNRILTGFYFSILSGYALYL